MGKKSQDQNTGTRISLARGSSGCVHTVLFLILCCKMHDNITHTIPNECDFLTFAFGRRMIPSVNVLFM